jgi:hypothetical protein
MKKLSILRLAAFALAVAVVVACGDSKLGPNVPASVSRVSGDSQTLLVGNRVSAPLVAVVKNSSGSPLSNIPVRWSVVSGGGSLTTIVDTTDVNGQVSSAYLSAAIVATAKVAASAADQAAEFTVTLLPDTVGMITAFGGDGAAALVGNPLTLTARAIDRFGNAIKGIDITWTTSSGQLQLQTATTDSTGKATNVITVGPDTGKVAVVATSRFNSITFTVSSLPDSI